MSTEGRGGFFRRTKHSFFGTKLSVELPTNLTDTNRMRALYNAEHQLGMKRPKIKERNQQLFITGRVRGPLPQSHIAEQIPSAIQLLRGGPKKGRVFDSSSNSAARQIASQR